MSSHRTGGGGEGEERVERAKGRRASSGREGERRGGGLEERVSGSTEGVKPMGRRGSESEGGSRRTGGRGEGEERAKREKGRRASGDMEGERRDD